MSMSDEYVSKVAISKAITAEALAQNLDSLYDNEASRYQRAAERIVAGMHAADVAPVRHGRWVATDRVGMVSGWKCSVCDAPCMRSSFNKVARSPYCPNCGAKMEVHNR